MSAEDAYVQICGGIADVRHGLVEIGRRRSGRQEKRDHEAERTETCGSDIVAGNVDGQFSDVV